MIRFESQLMLKSMRKSTVEQAMTVYTVVGATIDSTVVGATIVFSVVLAGTGSRVAPEMTCSFMALIIITVGKSVELFLPDHDGGYAGLFHFASVYYWAMQRMSIPTTLVLLLFVQSNTQNTSILVSISDSKADRPGLC